MKRFLPLLAALIIALPGYTEEETLRGYIEYADTPYAPVYLDGSIQPETLNLSYPHKIGARSLKTFADVSQMTFSNPQIKDMSKFSTYEYAVSPIGGTAYRKKGGFSYGTTYDAGIDTAQLEYSTKVFTRFDTERFALTTAYGKSIKTSTWNGADSIYVAPELKLGKGFSLQDVLSTNLTNQSKKNEVVLIYRPKTTKHVDGLRFELGAGQTVYADSNVNTSIRFSTRFKL